MPIPTPEERLGSALAGKYRLDAIIGRGGSGLLYRATHRWTGREVAVKVLHAASPGETSKAGRLLAEARAAAGLKHPHVVEVLDADVEDGCPYVVLELLSGRSLGDELKVRGHIEPALALSWLLPIIGAVETAHTRGILHRDIKLDNIFLAQDSAGGLRIKLLDFGLARPVDDQTYMTDSGVVVGTPAFMSPEQARAESSIGPPADVWSLGVVLFAALSGSLPFDAETTTAILVKIVTTSAPRLGEVAPHVPHNLAHAVDRALQRDVSLRYASARELAHGLALAARRDGVELPRAPDPIGLPEWRSWLTKDNGPVTTQSVEVPATTVAKGAPRRSSLGNVKRNVLLAATLAAALLVTTLLMSHFRVGSDTSAPSARPTAPSTEATVSRAAQDEGRTAPPRASNPSREAKSPRTVAPRAAASGMTLAANVAHTRDASDAPRTTSAAATRSGSSARPPSSTRKASRARPAQRRASTPAAPSAEPGVAPPSAAPAPDPLQIVKSYDQAK